MSSFPALSDIVVIVAYKRASMTPSRGGAVLSAATTFMRTLPPDKGRGVARFAAISDRAGDAAPVVMHSVARVGQV